MKTIHSQTYSLKLLLLNSPSTATLVKESSTVSPSFLSQMSIQKSDNYLAVKLNRLKDKQVRFKSRKRFFSHCMTNGLVPKELEFMLEATFGNPDQNVTSTRNLNNFHYL